MIKGWTSRVGWARGLSLASAAITLVAMTGCGGGNVSSVGGKVTYNGQPVTAGTLIFMPMADPAKKGDPGKPGEAVVQSDGSYKVGTYGTSDGAEVGKHRVQYSAPILDAGRELKPGESPPLSPFAGLVPKTPEVEVKSGGNTIDIELVKPGA